MGASIYPFRNLSTDHRKSLNAAAIPSEIRAAKIIAKISHKYDVQLKVVSPLDSTYVPGTQSQLEPETPKTFGRLSAKSIIPKNMPTDATTQTRFQTAFSSIPTSRNPR